MIIKKFEVLLRYKALDKDGGTWYMDTLKVWAMSEVRAIELAKKKWQRCFRDSDLTLTSITI